jgi:hypothetical protein
VAYVYIHNDFYVDIQHDQIGRALSMGMGIGQITHINRLAGVMDVCPPMLMLSLSVGKCALWQKHFGKISAQKT